MKIKTQFNLLIAGIIIVPILSAASLSLIWRILKEDAPSAVSLYERFAPYFSADSVQQRALRELTVSLWSNTSIALFRRIEGSGQEDPGMVVLHSGIEDFIIGDQVAASRVYSLIQSENPRYGYTFEPVSWLQDGEVFLLIRIDRAIRSIFNPVFIIFRTLIAVFIMLFVFVLIMSIVIIRSITRSILVLEDATRRIAAGELDMQMDVLNTGFLRRDNEITSLTHSLNRMRLALKEDGQRRSRFIMGITHDLKTPLTLIKGYTEAIRDGVSSGPEARNNSLAIITGKVEQLEGMITDLINFVRLDTGEWRGTLRKVKLRAFLEAQGRRFKDDAELLRRRAEYRIEVPGELPVFMDEALVSRALENLVNNALRYTGEGDVIRLRASVMAGERAGDMTNKKSNKKTDKKIDKKGGERAVIIEVEDTGPGIAEADLPHVFEIFYRGGNFRGQQGMGLGLPVVKDIMESHGWEITVESPAFADAGEGGLGRGTRFRIRIPWAEDLAAEDPAVEGPGVEGPAHKTVDLE
jgi:signal transduction histidine kinase